MASSVKSIQIRAYMGRFPRIMRKYVREDKKLTLEDGIRKFSASPAQRMRLADRGVLKERRFVLVNGVPVIEDGKMTDALPGKVLRGAGR